MKAGLNEQSSYLSPNARSICDEEDPCAASFVHG